MDKEEFNNLSIEKQVEEFNKLYVSEGSIRKACDKLKIGKTTIRDRFKKHGYTFKDDKYSEDTNTQQEDKTSFIEPACENKQDITDLEQLINKLIDKRLSELQKIEKVDIELDSKCEGDTIYRSYGVFKTVTDEFNEYAKKHSRYSKVELVSQALIEFMQNHK